MPPSITCFSPALPFSNTPPPHLRDRMAICDSVFTDDETFDPLGRFEEIEGFFNFPADGDSIDSLVSTGDVNFSDIVDAVVHGGGGDDGVSVAGGDYNDSTGAVAVHTVASTLAHADMSILAPFEDLKIVDDIADEIAWVSDYLEEDSNSYSVDLAKIPTTFNVNPVSNDGKHNYQFQTSSPVSVLEPNRHACEGTLSLLAPDSSSSSSSSSSGLGISSNADNGFQFPNNINHPEFANINHPEFANNINHPEPVLMIPGRARTKRPRPRPALIPSRMQVPVPDMHFSDDLFDPIYEEPESFGDYNPPSRRKKKKNASVFPINIDETGANKEEDGSLPMRKCTHCEITKTPQWRAGPRGPKTLCNACGVRYKSGRLYPEYRPAASPTFTPAQHSNSHKKVVEMRIKASHRTAAPLPDNPAAKGCDLLQFIRIRD